MQRDGFVRQRPDEIGLPVPLVARRIETVVHTLECGMRDRPDHVERRSLQDPYRLERFLPFLDRSGVAPHDAAHLLVVQVLGERCDWGYGEERKKTIKV